MTTTYRQKKPSFKNLATYWAIGDVQEFKKFEPKLCHRVQYSTQVISKMFLKN